ncbi:MAG: hypothetical protein JOZ19_17245 [Rubrobacter sp.]|nr:hypothetical protein [Rubrobacter sp.]
MRHFSGSEREPEHYVLCSKRIVLRCLCGEKMILLGQEEDWYSERRTVFECGCGERLTLADRLDEKDEEVVGVMELLRSLRAHDRN